MKLASFDLEICDELNSSDPTFVPRISCAAVALNDTAETLKFWTNPDGLSMTTEYVHEMVNDLARLVEEGYTLLTWNGVAFDFKVVEHYAVDLAPLVRSMSWRNHIDMMLLVSFQKGHFLGLDTALAGHNIGSKLHQVTLSDGTILTDMSGAKAPELWRRGERQAVLQYLAVDVQRPLELANDIYKVKHIEWTSKSGKPQFCTCDLYTVEQAFNTLPEPRDTSWMSDPIDRRTFINKYLPGILEG